MKSATKFHTVYVRTEMVWRGIIEEIRGLCFEVYGMLRASKPGLIGNIEYMEKLIKAKKAQNAAWEI